MYFVYILQSENSNWFYKGITDNLERRLKQHFQGQVKSTKQFLPLKLVHAEICLDRIEARKLEKYFKSGYGREIILELTENLRTW